jgi:hypothetical protein
MTSIQFDDSILGAAAAKAIVTTLGSEMKDKWITDAVTESMKEQKGDYGRTKPSKFDLMVKRTVESALEDAVQRFIQQDEESKSLIQEAALEGFKQYLKDSGNVQHYVAKAITNGLAESAVDHDY